MSKWIEDAITERIEAQRQAEEDRQLSERVQRTRQLLAQNILEAEGVIINTDNLRYGAVYCGGQGGKDYADMMYHEGANQIRFNGYVRLYPLPEALVSRDNPHRWEYGGCTYPDLVSAIIAARQEGQG